MERKSFDLVVIGSGPGGYVAAIRAAQRGKNCCLVEAKETGGTCLNRGCIPSKALIASADRFKEVKEASLHGITTGNVSFNYEKIASNKDQVVTKIRKSLEGLIASNKITRIMGFAKFISPYEVKILGNQELLIEAKQFILATGSEPRGLPFAPFDYEKIHDSTSILNLTQLPKSLLVIGGGVIGCEFASLHHTFGVNVTILELMPTLIPMEGKQTADALMSGFKKRGISMLTDVRITKVEKEGNQVSATLQDGKKIEAEMALISVGRKYNSEAIGLEKTGVIIDENGAIPTNDQMQTNVSHIFAIGDLTGKSLLAHVASHQGVVAADNAAGHRATMNYMAIPSVIFTDPEVATVGLSLEKALAAGYDAILGKFPFAALGKAQAMQKTDGFAQIVVAKSTGQILGAQVVGYGAATLIAEMTLAIENELTIESIYHTIHAHPTLSEGWMEAAFLVSGMPIHLPPTLLNK